MCLPPDTCHPGTLTTVCMQTHVTLGMRVDVTSTSHMTIMLFVVRMVMMMTTMAMMMTVITKYSIYTITKSSTSPDVFPTHNSKQFTKSHNPKAEADGCGRLRIPPATAGTTSQPPPRVANNSILSLSIYTGLARGATIRSGATPAAVAHHRGQRCRTIGTMAAGTKSCQRYDRCWCCRRRPL